MLHITGRTEGERRVKAAESVRRSTRAVAHAADEVLSTLIADASASLAKLGDDRGGERRVHKLRATLRRLEIAVGVVGCGFEERWARKLEKTVRRARKRAGEVRDLDVAIVVIRQLATEHSDDAAFIEAAADVESTLDRRRIRALKKLRAFSRDSIGDLEARLSGLLDAPADARSRLPVRCPVVAALAYESEVIRDAAQSGLTTVERLHDLRLNLKKVRTVLELFGPVLTTGAADRSSTIAERTKKLSDSLGAVNDLASLAELVTTLQPKRPSTRRDHFAAVADVVSAAHDKAHKAAVRVARDEAVRLVDDLRRVIFS